MIWPAGLLIVDYICMLLSVSHSFSVATNPVSFSQLISLSLARGCLSIPLSRPILSLLYRQLPLYGTASRTDVDAVVWVLSFISDASLTCHLQQYCHSIRTCVYTVKDGCTIHIPKKFIYFAYSCTVYVGLAEARPNNMIVGG